MNFVDVDTSKACVKKPFTSMIIGLEKPDVTHSVFYMSLGHWSM